MNLFNYVLFLVCFYVERSHGGGGGGHKIIHEKLRIHVPEFIKHGHHTKFIVIHHHPVHKGHHHHESHHHKPHSYSFSHNKGHAHSTRGHSFSHGIPQHVPHGMHKVPKMTHPAPMKHHVSKIPSHMGKAPSHDDDYSSGAPQIYGVQHVHKETNTYSTDPYGFSAARPSVPSQGYEVSEEPEAADEDFGYQDDKQPVAFGNTYSAGIPQTYGSGVQNPFSGDISQNFNSIPQSYGAGLSQDYGSAVQQTGYGDDGGNSIYQQEGFYGGGSDFQPAPPEEQYNEGYQNYQYGNDQPAADFGQNTDHFSDEHKDFINTISGNQQAHFSDDTPVSYSQAGGFQTLTQTGGHETLNY